MLTGATALGAVAAASIAGDSLWRWNAAWTVAGLCAVLGLLAGSREADASQRSAWRLLIASAAAWLVGQILWDVFAATGFPDVPGPADVAWLATAPLMAVALSRLLPVHGPGARLAWLETLALVVTAGTVLGALLHPLVTESGAGVGLKATAVAYPLFFVSVPIVVIQGLVASEITPRRGPAIYLLVAGTVVQAVAFSLWSPQLLDGSYEVGATAVDALWVAGMTAVGIGGALHRSRELAAPRRKDRRFAGLLPASMFFVLLAHVAHAAIVDAPLGERQLLQAGLFVVGTILITRSALLARTQRVLIRSIASTLAELRRMREASGRFFEMSSDLLATIDRDGRLVEVNPTWHEALGWSTAELTAGPFEEFIHPDDRERTRRAIGALVPGRPRLTGVENRWLAKDGSYRWINWRSHRSADDELVYATGTDVTDRKDVESQLETRVAERTRALAAANEELEAFAYAVSHDLRAPLRAVAGFAQALAEDYGDKLEREGRDYVDRVVGGTSRMARLIDQLLALSRITRQDMRHEPVDLSELIDEVIAELAGAEPDRDVTIEVSGDLRTSGDRVLLETLLRNLVGNAWKFTQRADRPFIEIGAEGSNGDRVFYVRDNGAGFDPEHAGKLFRPFERLHRADEFNGTGIGLATVRRIVARHGGEIWAEAKPGEGATFYFRLPRGPGK